MDRRRVRQVASGAAFVAICVVAVVIVVSQAGGGSGGTTELEGIGVVRSELRGIPQHGTMLGDPHASVNVVEYGDLQCPVCRGFAIDAAPDLIDRVVRAGRATYDLRQWPIIGQPPHAQSTAAAKAALAASLQHRYWNYVELFYRNQGAEDSGYVTDSFLTAIARGAGIPDIARWRRDRRLSKWDRSIARTSAEAKRLDLAGAPSFVIRGPHGAQALTAPSFDQIEGAIRNVQ